MEGLNAEEPCVYCKVVGPCLCDPRGRAPDDGVPPPKRELSFALGVPHTPWVPERAASMARLREQLELGGPVRLGADPLTYSTFTEKCPNHVWSEALWSWGLSTGCSHLVQIQDDAVVAPNFWGALRAMVTAQPDAVIALEAVHPAGMTLAREWKRWYTTVDGLIGVGYVLPSATLDAMLRWRREELKPGAVEAVTEDTLLAMFCVATGRRIWCPVPTIIDHDVTIASTYANDGHPFRRPSVTWRDGDVGQWDVDELADPHFWELEGDAPTHLGRFYPSVHHLAAMWSKSYTLNEAKKIEADVCPPARARFFR